MGQIRLIIHHKERVGPVPIIGGIMHPLLVQLALIALLFASVWRVQTDGVLFFDISHKWYTRFFFTVVTKSHQMTRIYTVPLLWILQISWLDCRTSIHPLYCAGEFIKGYRGAQSLPIGQLWLRNGTQMIGLQLMRGGYRIRFFAL